MTAEDAWVNRIVDFDSEVDPGKLAAHPLNARVHPEMQKQAIRDSLGRIGWVDVVKVNTRSGRIIDGHARVEEALAAGESVPVLWVDLSDEEEAVALAAIDPIGALAEYDNQLLLQLLETSGTQGTGFSGDDVRDLEAMLEESASAAESIMGEVTGIEDHVMSGVSSDLSAVGASAQEPAFKERIDEYAGKGVRTIVLELSIDQFKWWADHAGPAREKYAVATNAELALHLLADSLGLEVPE